MTSSFAPRSASQFKKRPPPGSNTGQTLRLKGRGIKKGGTAGDQLVKLAVVMPERIDDELKSFAERWRESHGYDPRRKLKEQA